MDQEELNKIKSVELLKLFARVMEELRQRKVVRSSNNPVADYAESLVCQALKLELAPRSTKGYDAIDQEGRKYEIKGRRPTRHQNSRQLSVIRGLDEKHFDYLAAVLFKEDFSIDKGCLVPHDAVRRGASYRKHVNGWILHLRDSVWDEPEVIDITNKLRNAQKR